MNILYDHQIFSAQKIGGASRYFAELFLNFNKLDGVDFELALNYSDNIYIKNTII